MLRARGSVRGVLRNIPSEVTKRCGLHFISLCPAELSLYELHRKPHEMVTDSTVVAVSPRALRSELMCPICLDLMRTPLTTKEVVVFACFPPFVSHHHSHLLQIGPTLLHVICMCLVSIGWTVCMYFHVIAWSSMTHALHTNSSHYYMVILEYLVVVNKHCWAVPSTFLSPPAVSPQVLSRVYHHSSPQWVSR